DAEVGVFVDGLGQAHAQFGGRSPAVVVAVDVVAAHHAGQGVRTPGVPVTGVETRGHAVVVVGPVATHVAVAAGAIDEEVDRGVRRNEAANAQAVVHLTAVGVAVGVVVVATHRRRNVPAVVVAVRPHALVTGNAAVLSGHGVVLHVLGVHGEDAATQGHGNQQTQALTFHLKSPLF